MTDRDMDQAELEAARQAVRTAQMGTVRSDAIIETIHRSSARINELVQENGYVGRFRQVLRGTN